MKSQTVIGEPESFFYLQMFLLFLYIRYSQISFFALRINSGGFYHGKEI